MNYRRLVEIGCKFIAINLFVKYIGLLPGSIINLFYMNRNIMIEQGILLISSLSPMIFMILLSLLLWMNADKISKLAVKDEYCEELIPKVNYNKIQLIIFSFAGVLIIAIALPEAVNLITQVIWLTTQQIIRKGDRNYIIYVSRIIGQIIQVLLGLWLILGLKGIMNCISTLRTAGIREHTDDD